VLFFDCDRALVLADLTARLAMHAQDNFLALRRNLTNRKQA